ncbi:hypothetical protein EVAR_60484_1 [Eumeta japonica]|uniref:Uncharacterized protein n=1 Tax=Eumeta variegata TaxID=151549 RepID=A0A4C1ZVG0_EUMVA|nr:hypothetical protein EVAR_60484_1 [Eumeta japonica]
MVARDPLQVANPPVAGRSTLVVYVIIIIGKDYRFPHETRAGNEAPSALQITPLSGSRSGRRTSRRVSGSAALRRPIIYETFCPRIANLKYNLRSEQLRTNRS